jgi:phosphoglycolate phosphatase
MSIRLIAFDLDGTLIDSVADIAAALNHVLEPWGVSAFSPGEAAGLVGNGVLRLIEKAIELRGLHLDAASLVRPHLDYYSEHLTDHSRLYPGVIETLERLTWCCKVLVSNKVQDATIRTLKAFGLSGYFDLVLGGDSFPEMKPSPVAIHHALDVFGVRADEALMVGDSEIDVAAGKAARVKTVAVKYGYGRAGFEAAADFVVDEISELVAIVEELGSRYPGTTTLLS